MHTVHIHTVDENNRVRLVIDDDHKPEYGTGDDAEDARLVREEYAAIESGEWVALGAIKEKRCACCGVWSEADSLWGIVVDNSDKGYREAIDEAG